MCHTSSPSAVVLGEVHKFKIKGIWSIYAIPLWPLGAPAPAFFGWNEERETTDK